jgi:type III secretion protein S
MNSVVLSQEIYLNFRAGAILAGVPVAIAIALGIMLSIFQAATQIQDQALPALAKVIVIIGVLMASGYSLSQPLVEHTRSLFASFHGMTR